MYTHIICPLRYLLPLSKSSLCLGGIFQVGIRTDGKATLFLACFIFYLFKYQTCFSLVVFFFFCIVVEYLNTEHIN